MRPALRLAAVLALGTLAMLYGMVSYSLELPPYGTVERLHRGMFDAPAEAAPAPAPAEIRVRSADDVADARARLIDLLWGDVGLPTRLPDLVEPGIADTVFAGLDGVQRVDRLVVDMDFGLRSQAYHFMPAQPNGRVVIYHAGHGQDVPGAKLLVEMLAREGYAVIALEMPLEGGNATANHARVRGGTVELTGHGAFELLRPEHGHALRYFIEPVIVAINQAQREFGYGDVAMIGLSGGGWTTTLAAAVDPRIRLSFPVAGSLPRHLRVTAAERGDWEQRAPEVYEIAGYRELYILGAHGTGRRQMQVLNINDPCCFGGLGWQTYAGQVAGLVERIGPGEFHILADDTHSEHAISYSASHRILQELAR